MTCTTRHLPQARTIAFGPSHALNNDARGRDRAPSSLNGAAGSGGYAVAALCLHLCRG
jgi:hypothetical protein